jgi:fatty acid desaturase
VRLATGILEGGWENRILTGENARLKAGWARAQVTGHLALGVAFGVAGRWMLIPILLVPFCSGCLAILCAIPQHLGMKPDVPDWRLGARTVLINPVLRFLYWQMNYHVEHHMYAAVPFHALGKLHRLIAADMPKPNRGIVSAWREIAAWQRRQQGDPSCVVDPWARTG